MMSSSSARFISSFIDLAWPPKSSGSSMPSLNASATRRLFSSSSLSIAVVVDFEIVAHEVGRESDKTVSPFGGIRALLPINAVFSHDGKWVAYQAGRAGENGVFVQPFPATGARIR